MSAETTGWQAEYPQHPELAKALGDTALPPSPPSPITEKPSLVVYTSAEAQARDEFFEAAKRKGISPELQTHAERPAFAGFLQEYIHDWAARRFDADVVKWRKTKADPIAAISSDEPIQKPMMPAPPELIKLKLFKVFYPAVQLGSPHKSHQDMITQIRAHYEPIVAPVRLVSPELRHLEFIGKSLSRSEKHQLAYEAALDLTVAYGMVIVHLDKVSRDQTRDELQRHKPPLVIE